MTPLQTSSDPEVADWEKPLGAACFTRRLGSAWSGVVLGADWDRRPSGRRSLRARQTESPLDASRPPNRAKTEDGGTGKSPLQPQHAPGRIYCKLQLRSSI